MKNRAQATLEFTVTFAIMVILLFSLLSLWKKWCDKIIERQRNYSRTRVESGSIDMGTGQTIPHMPDPTYIPPTRRYLRSLPGG